MKKVISLVVAIMFFFVGSGFCGSQKKGQNQKLKRIEREEIIHNVVTFSLYDGKSKMLFEYKSSYNQDDVGKPKPITKTKSKDGKETYSTTRKDGTTITWSKTRVEGHPNIYDNRYKYDKDADQIYKVCETSVWDGKTKSYKIISTTKSLVEF